jgi:hypothetical protein
MKIVLIGLTLLFSFSAQADIKQEIVQGTLVASPTDQSTGSQFFSGYELESSNAQGNALIYDINPAGNPCGRGISNGALAQAGIGASIELNGFVEPGSDRMDENGVLHQEFVMQVLPDGERLHVLKPADSQL